MSGIRLGGLGVALGAGLARRSGKDPKSVGDGACKTVAAIRAG